MNNLFCFIFFFNDTAPTEIYTLPLHDALPISTSAARRTPGTAARGRRPPAGDPRTWAGTVASAPWLPTRSPSTASTISRRSEEHTSELQSRQYLVCRLLLEKKKNMQITDLYI